MTLLTLVGCGPKEAPVTSAQAANAAPVDAQPHGPAEAADPEPEDAAEPAEEETTTSSVSASEVEPETEDVSHSHPVDMSPDPRQLLETSLEAVQSAGDDMRNGHLDEAIQDLDLAYSLILDIEDQDEDILQEKDDLRILIARRIIEVNAARRTVAGDVSGDIPLVMNKHVEREIQSFQGREREFFLESYKRSGRYRQYILEELRKEGLPEQLSWLPLIESGFKTSALSRARALGLWQFISATGYRYGMSRDQFIDERMDPEKSTQAAIRYLVDLHGLFGDWMSALAGYNCGEGRVMRAIKRQHINYLDNFWDLYDQLPRETARYVPRFLATLYILQDPEKYGFTLPEVDPPFDYKHVTAEKSIRLEDLDELAGVEKGTFKALNPELRYGVTPDKPYTLRAPTPVFETVSAGISNLQRYELPENAFITHRVGRGETLGLIARKYNSSVSDIVRANLLRSQHRISIGQRLKIPRKGARMIAVAAPQKPASSPTGNKITVHRVARGDSLWRLAQHYKVSVNDIKALNGLSGNSLSLGQELKIQRPAEQPAKYYTVQHGDTLGKIAAKHQVSLSSLLRANNMTKRDKIFPNQKLLLP